MKKSLKVYDHIPMYSKRMLSVNYTPLQRKIVLEVQQTEIEKLAESFKLAGLTLVDSLKNPSNPWQTVLIFSAFYSSLRPFFSLLLLF